MNRLRGVITGVLVVLTSVSLLASTISIWVSSTLLDTDSFTELVDESLQEPAATEAISAFVTRQLTDALVESEVVDRAIPDALGAATPLVEAALSGVIEDQTRRLVSSDAGRALVVETVRSAHRAAVAVIEAEPPPEGSLVVIDDETVSLNLLPVVARVVERLRELGVLADDVDVSDVGAAGDRRAQLNVFDRELDIELDDDFAQFVVYERRADDALSVVGAAQRAIETMHRVQVLQLISTFLLGLLTLATARNRRRVGISLGLGVFTAFVLAALVVRRVSEAVPRLLTDPVAREAVRSVIERTTQDLDAAIVQVITLSALVVIASVVWLSPRARRTSRDLAGRFPDACRAASIVLALVVLFLTGLRPFPIVLASAIVVATFLSTRHREDSPIPH